MQAQNKHQPLSHKEQIHIKSSFIATNLGQGILSTHNTKKQDNML